MGTGKVIASSPNTTDSDLCVTQGAAEKIFFQWSPSPVWGNRLFSLLILPSSWPMSFIQYWNFSSYSQLMSSFLISSATTNLFLFSYFSCHFHGIWGVEKKKQTQMLRVLAYSLNPFMISPVALTVFWWIQQLWDNTSPLRTKWWKPQLLASP